MMVGLGRAAMPRLGVGRGRPLLPSFSPASEPQPAAHTQLSQTGRESLKHLFIYSFDKLERIKGFLQLIIADIWDILMLGSNGFSLRKR